MVFYCVVPLSLHRNIPIVSVKIPNQGNDLDMSEFGFLYGFYMMLTHI